MNRFIVETEEGKLYEEFDDELKVVMDSMANLSYDDVPNKVETNIFVNFLMKKFYKNGCVSAVLVDEDDVFIWSIVINPAENDTYNYMVYNYRIDDKRYKFENPS